MSIVGALQVEEPNSGDAYKAVLKVCIASLSLTLILQPQTSRGSLFIPSLCIGRFTDKFARGSMTRNIQMLLCHNSELRGIYDTYSSLADSRSRGAGRHDWHIHAFGTGLEVHP